MDFSNSLTFRIRPNSEYTKKAGQKSSDELKDAETDKAGSHEALARCPNFAGFLAICFSGPDTDRGFHPVLTNTSPGFDDVTLSGGSFDVRQTKASSFPLGLDDELLRGREFVVVKHPRPVSDDVDNAVHLSEIAMELQVLRHSPIKSHPNVIDLLAVMYHDAGDVEQKPKILPALVLEHAQFGSLKTFQEQGYGHSFEDKVAMALDTAEGIKALHDCGIIHGDVKTSNMLVCKHSTRKFIVKVSDFGFSLTVSDKRLLGHTELLSAPEAYGNSLDPRFLKQLDIYCYGLLLHAVLKDGTPTYTAALEHGTGDDMKNIKAAGLMGPLNVLNVLLTGPGREQHPLLIFCKVILYSLKLRPQDRFHDMSRIVFHLRLLQTGIDTAAETGRTPDQTKLTECLHTAFANTGGESPGQTNEVNTLHSLKFIPFEQFQSGEHIDGFYLCSHEAARTLRGQLTAAAEAFIGVYSGKLSLYQIPMIKTVIEQLRSRIGQQISHLFQMPDPGSDASTARFAPRRAYFFLLDCFGLIPEDESPLDNSMILPLLSINPTPVSVSSQLELCTETDLIPDVSLVSGIMKKMPWSVQEAALESLFRLNDTTPETEEIAKVKILLSLASAYTDGVGVEVDLRKAADYVFRAASFKDPDVLTKYINTFSSLDSARTLDQGTWRSWLWLSAEGAGNPTALAKMRYDLEIPEVADYIARSLCAKELKKAGMVVSVGDIGKVEAPLDSAPKADLQSTLLRAVVEGRQDVVERCMALPANLDEADLGNNEHALLVACRLGKFEIAKGLVSPRNANLGNRFGIRPLHWLSSFTREDEARNMASLLKHNGADTEALAVSVQRFECGLKFDDVLLKAWTPLHWAVVADSASAVLALLHISSKATFRPNPDGGVQHMTPLELACYHCHADALSALLTDQSVRQEVDSPRPMVVGNPVMIRPLFQVLQSGNGSGWNRLRRLGPKFKEKTEETISLLIENGATTDSVLQFGTSDAKMSAAFATAYHSCCADIMASGLKLGFSNGIDSTFGSISSGGSPLFLAITHRDRAMFTTLVEAGADLSARDTHGFTPLMRAAKEHDDLFFTQVLLNAGETVDPKDPSITSAFFTATYCGNYKVARYLFDRGADRDRIASQINKTILGEMLQLHTRNALARVKFLLSLPDREGGSDGFIAAHVNGEEISVFHLAIPSAVTSSRHSVTSRAMVAQLLAKFSRPEQINSTSGPHAMTPLAMAAEVGNHGVVRQFLSAGADPNIPDKFGRTALDLVHKHYCYPELLVALEKVDKKDSLSVARSLEAINSNTSEVLSLLKSYKAELRSFRFPSWFQSSSSYRSVEWVLERLEEQTPNVFDEPGRQVS